MPYLPPSSRMETASFEPKPFTSLLKRYRSNTERPDFQAWMKLHPGKYFIDIRRDVGLAAVCSSLSAEQVCHNTWQWYKYWIPVFNMGRAYWSMSEELDPMLDIVHWTEAVTDLLKEFMIKYPADDERCWNPDWLGKEISAEGLRAPPGKSAIEHRRFGDLT